MYQWPINKGGEGPIVGNHVTEKLKKAMLNPFS